MCEKSLPDSCVPAVGRNGERGRFKVFRQCSDHRGRALGRDLDPFVDVESVVQEVPDTMTGSSWPVTRSKPWHWTQAVRIGEAGSPVEAVRLRAAAEGGRTARVLLLGDNMAVS